MKKRTVLLLGAVLASVGFGATYNIDDGETLVVTDAINNDSTIINAYGGSTVVLATSTNQTYLASYAKIVALGGEVTVSNAYGDVWRDYWFVNGLRTKIDQNVDGSFRIYGAKRLMIGRNSVSSYGINYPPCELSSVVFEEEGSQGVCLRDKSTLRKMPEDCALTIADGATVALQGSASLLDLLGGTDNTLTLDKYDVICCTSASLPENCQVNVPPGRTLTFRSAANNAWNWGTANGSSGYYRVALGGKGAKVVCRSQNATLRLESELSGEGELVIRSEKDSFKTIYRGVTYTATKGQGDIVLSVSDAHLPPPTDGWQKKVAHWFDASDHSTQILLDYDFTGHAGWEGVKNEFEGHPIIMGLKDVKKGTSDTFLYNPRIFSQGGPLGDPNGYVLQTTPYLVREGLNGLDYISCGKCNSTTNGAKYVNGQLAAADEVRRLRFWKGEASGHENPNGDYVDELLPYCIMVYNSANGGGKAILGTRESTDTAQYGNLARANSDTRYAWAAYPGFSFVEDGRNTNPQNNNPKGCWQIVSLDMSATNTYVNAIGRHQADNLSGGQDYAEVIFFSERPTPAERYACELYLAEKWGLMERYRPRGASVATLTGKSNASVELCDTEAPTFDSNAEVTVDGDFTGTIEVPEGRTLVVSDKPVPPTEVDVPSANRLAWYDPSFTAALTTNTLSTCAGAVKYLRSRTLDAIDSAWVMCGNETSGKTHNAREPYLAEASLGGTAAAPVMPWMDFSKEGSGDTLSNTLRSHTSETVGGSSTKMNIRQAFMVLDTSKGGGSPIGDEVGFGTNIKYRDHNGAVASDPIWAAGNTSAAAMDATWLDTEAVDGTKHGFNGRGEVLSFTTKATLGVRFMGYYNVGMGNEKEVIGESIFYSSPLSDAERQTTQEYLMYKWFGDLNGKYSDLTKATVTGAGNVRVASPAALAKLPVLSEGFTGAIEFGGETLALTAGETVEVPRKVALPEVLTVDLTAAPTMGFGEYTLLTAAGGIDGATTVVVRPTAGSDMTVRYRVKKVGSSLVLTVTGRGLTLLLK